MVAWVGFWKIDYDCFSGQTFSYYIMEIVNLSFLFWFLGLVGTIWGKSLL